MAITVTHKFTDTHPDGADATLVRPSNWNDEHDISGDAPDLGSLIAGDGTGWVAFAPGSDGTVLSSNSAQPDGLEWIALPPSPLVGWEQTTGSPGVTQTTPIDAPGGSGEAGPSLVLLPGAGDTAGLAGSIVLKPAAGAHTVDPTTHYQGGALVLDGSNQSNVFYISTPYGAGGDGTSVTWAVGDADNVGGSLAITAGTSAGGGTGDGGSLSFSGGGTTTAIGEGGAINITGGYGYETGGNIRIESGDSFNSGGDVLILTGDGDSGLLAGNIHLLPGSGGTAKGGGNVIVEGGPVLLGANGSQFGGAASLIGGADLSTNGGFGGIATVSGGASSHNVGGAAKIFGGAAAGVATGGNVEITSGAGTGTGNSGDILLTIGDAGSGIPGTFTFKGGTGFSTILLLDGSATSDISFNFTSPLANGANGQKLTFASGGSSDHAGGLLSFVSGSGATSGGDMNFAAGNGSAGGSCSFNAGTSDTGPGGNFTATAGSASATNGSGGTLLLQAGSAPTGTGLAGGVLIEAGNGPSTGTNGAYIELITGTDPDAITPGGDIFFAYGTGSRNGLFFPNLPTSDPGISGAMYVDGLTGIVKVSP